MQFLNNMYLLINQLKNIKASSFKINDKHQIFVNSDNKIKIFNGQNIGISSFEKPRVTIIKDCNVWIGDASSGKSVIYCDSKPKKTVDFLAITLRDIDFFSTKDYFYPRVYLKGNLSAPRYARVSNKDYSIVDLFPEKFGFNGFYLVVDDSCFLSNDNNKIGLFNFENKLIWQHNFIDLLQIQNPEVIGLYSDIIRIKDNIYLYLAGRDENGKGNKGTFCINIETGKIKNIYTSLVSFSYPEGNLLYNLHNNKLNILNTITQVIETIDFSEEFKKHNIHTDQVFAVQNGLIYFKQSMGDIVSKVGILDPKKEKVIWKYEFPKGSGQVGSLQVQGNRIYVHTQDKTLHVFEKE